MMSKFLIYGPQRGINKRCYEVPYRQNVFSSSIILRVYFKYDRSLLKGFYRYAYLGLVTFHSKENECKEWSADCLDSHK